MRAADLNPRCPTLDEILMLRRGRPTGRVSATDMVTLPASPPHLTNVEEHMLTICWAAKGGSGTTVYAAAAALSAPARTLLIDLAGDVMPVLGLADGDGPGIHDWLVSESPPERIGRLEQIATELVSVIPSGPNGASGGSGGSGRWFELAAHLRNDSRRVIVDAGTGRPPAALLTAADESLLVTRGCYHGLRRAVALGVNPTGVVLVHEPGRSLRADDIEAAIGAPVVHTALLDPAIARAVDAGLLLSRLPGAWRRQLRRAA
jgi:hypothetical protein